MKLHHVKQFIQSLLNMQERLKGADLKFLADLQNWYLHAISGVEGSLSLDEKPLRESDFNWLKELFAERWQNIADTTDDYTFDPAGINVPWIDFAKSLALELHKPFLLILMPTLANVFEPNNLSRLSEVQDPRAIFISKRKGDANKITWHRIKALHDEINKPSGVFGVLDTPKSLKPRALTLDELFRVRSKRGGNELVFRFSAREDEQYLNFWDYIIRKVVPGLQDDKSYPTFLLPPLLDVIEKYFDAKADPETLSTFKMSFKLFKEHLAVFPLSDVNNFYGTPIQVKGKNFFLVEILLDCFQNKVEESLDDKLISVAKWICEVDPSLVSKKEVLKPVYESLHAGSYFNLDFLYGLVADLNVNTKSIVRPLFMDLLSYLEFSIEAKIGDEAETRAQLVSKIKAMYALRWEKIVDSTIDYTRMQTGVNGPWIRLAQYLAGAGFVEANYYRLLIPTLKHDVDSVSQEPLTTYPFSKYVLSTSGRELIFLPNCVQHHRVNGTFYNCNYREPMPLSHKEKKRLAFADPEIYNYFLNINEGYEDPSLSKRTIDEIRKLVNGSLNPTGLSNSQVSVTEYSSATKSYDDFIAYVSELPPEEKNSLYRQRILLRSNLVSVQEILDLIQSTNYEERECIAVLGKYFAKLVIDYAPETKFRDEIEQSVDISSMRAASAKKIYSDYSELSEEEAKRRLLIIFSSLMTHSFQYLWFTGISVSLGGHDNKVTETGKEIFNWINKAITKGDLRQARFLYVQLVEHIIKPSLANKSWCRYPDTKQWLTGIHNGYLFNTDTAEYFNPELLLVVLWPWMQRIPKLRSPIEGFLDELVEILISPNNNSKKWIMVNIEFSKLLNSEVIVGVQAEILTELRKSSKTSNISLELVAQTGKDYLIHRLAQAGARDVNCRQSGMFGKSPGHYSTTYGHLKRLLNEKLLVEMPENSSDAPSLQEIAQKLQQIVVANERREFAKLLAYLQGLCQQTLAHQSLGSERVAARTVMTMA